MDGFELVAQVDDIPQGASKCVTVQGRPIALFNVSGQIFAIHDLCPHEGGPLHKGRLKGCVIACPWHDLAFDVRNGQGTDGGGYCVGSYDVKVEGTGVYVGGRRKRS